MIAIPYKAKQFLLVIIKLLIVSGALFYIYSQLQNSKKLNVALLFEYFNLQTFFVLLLFSVGNWILEIIKWQNLVSSFKTIRFQEAAQQSLGSLTASIFTPNRIGEYGAKMLYYPKQNAKKIVFLNFISNSSQMAVTCFFGILGFAVSRFAFTTHLFTSLLIIFIIVFFLFYFKEIEIYGFSIGKLLTKIKAIPKPIARTTFQLSVLRYLLFSHQFYFLLVQMNCEVAYSTALGTIFLMYLMASIIPSIHLMDVAIKGSVAVYLFGLLQIENWKILTITSLMWLFNLVLPVLIGSYFVLRFKPKTNE